MPAFGQFRNTSIDRWHIFTAAVVFVVSFIVYLMTVQQTLSFWDCGEFLACSNILGIPHPPGTPLFVLIGRLFTFYPFVTDLCHRLNMISVITSTFTALFSYLLGARLIRYMFNGDVNSGLSRFITYVGAAAGAFFVAFGYTNWGNAIEAEVYGLALALSVLIIYLAVLFYEQRGTPQAAVYMNLAMYLAMLGIGVHMTVYLVVPAAAIIFMLNADATRRDFIYICSFIIMELLLILAFANGRGGSGMFYLVSTVLGFVLLILLFRKINWPIALAIGILSVVMIAFSDFLKILPFGVLALLVLGYFSHKYNLRLQWKSALAMVIICVIGFSVHLYLPIRSEHSPRIDENHPARDYRTFINFLDRKQYGSESMVDRMFHRRGELSNQFGRHANMGFWSYFEFQWSPGYWSFVPFLLLGLYGLYVAIRKRLELGLPFLVLILLASVGLILYMNFADGTQYDPRTTDAYLEVRNRDYFFTPAFVFFGIAMGLGVAGVMQTLREYFGKSGEKTQKAAVFAAGILVFLPCVSLGHNWYFNDRSNNKLPYLYAKNLLDTCEPNAILFTSGDNDTFPVWCVQEVYNYRKDVRVVNLSLLNTDWYVLQMKEQYNVPISLTPEQILWVPLGENEEDGVRPVKPFDDRPRRRSAYLIPNGWNGKLCKVQDMMVDEIVIENAAAGWRDPIYFSAPPYGDSPLKLRERAQMVGMAYKLEKDIVAKPVNTSRGYDLFMNTYSLEGLQNPGVYRDDNATGVFQGIGVASTRVAEELLGENLPAATDSGLAILNHMVKVYPEYWQSYLVLAEHYEKLGDTTRADSVQQLLHSTLAAFRQKDPTNLIWMQDFGLAKLDISRRTKNAAMADDAIALLWESFNANPNNSISFRKLISGLSQVGRNSELVRAAQMHAQYKINANDPYLNSILGRQPTGPQANPDDL